MDLLKRARSEWEAGERDTLRDWLVRNPPSAAAFTQTLARVGERVRGGEQLLVAVREFLDEFQLLPTAQQRGAAIAERADPTGDERADAYIAALGEHLAEQHDLERPTWTTEPARFLSVFWFVSSIPGFRALALAESPAAFRRRGVFVSRGALERC